jgi:hypothetical protein
MPGWHLPWAVGFGGGGGAVGTGSAEATALAVGARLTLAEADGAVVTAVAVLLPSGGLTGSLAAEQALASPSIISENPASCAQS